MSVTRAVFQVERVDVKKRSALGELAMEAKAEALGYDAVGFAVRAVDSTSEYRMGKTTLANYQREFRSIRLERDDAGILVATLHTDGGPICWGGVPHRELTDFWEAASRDRDNRVVIITGTGDAFIDRMEKGDRSWVTPPRLAAMMREGRRMLYNHLEVPVPVIAAVNGPATVHAEQALLADIVLASPEACFADLAHFPSGVVPGDGIQTVFELLFGVNRARYLLYTGQRVSAEQALAWGAIGEIVAKDALLARARAIAVSIASKPSTVVRTTRLLLMHELQHRLLAGTTTGSLAECFAAMEHWPEEFATNRLEP